MVPLRKDLTTVMIRAVEFNRWLEVEELTDTAAAQILGLDQSMVTRLRNGERKASIPVALQIERRTKGKVGAAEVPLSKSSRKALMALRPAESAA